MTSVYQQLTVSKIVTKLADKTDKICVNIKTGSRFSSDLNSKDNWIMFDDFEQTIEYFVKFFNYMYKSYYFFDGQLSKAELKQSANKSGYRIKNKHNLVMACGVLITVSQAGVARGIVKAVRREIYKRYMTDYNNQIK